MPNYTEIMPTVKSNKTAQVAQPRAPRGRPKLQSDEDLLRKVVAAFAAQGYEAVSLRSLSQELGLSHSALGQRFGTKDALFRTAVDAEFTRFLRELAVVRATWSSALCEVEEFAVLLFCFLTTSAKFPALGQLMNQVGAEPSARLDYIVATVVQPQLRVFGDLVDRLSENGTIYPVTTRAMFFLVAHGAEAPFTLTALSANFDDRDGQLRVDAHVLDMVQLLLRSLLIDRSVLDDVMAVLTTAQRGTC
jgi:AcrR family transcriptional regulator